MKMQLIKDTKNRKLGIKEHQCRICGSKGMFQSYLAREMMNGTREEFEYFVCEKCDCLQIAKIPDDLAKYYGADYYSMQSVGNEDITFDIAPINSTKILDVGCGAGAWLLMMADNGYDSLFGCDPFIDKDKRFADRVYIKKGDITCVEGNGTFDLIRMCSSFEHMTNPKEVLDKAKELVKDDGLILITIPMYPNIAFDMFETHWFQLDAPRHIYLFSKKSFEYLAEESGLKICDYIYDSDKYMIINSFLYQHGISYFEINDSLIGELFSDDDLSRIDEQVKRANDSCKGDYVHIFLRK